MREVNLSTTMQTNEVKKQKIYENQYFNLCWDEINNSFHNPMQYLTHMFVIVEIRRNIIQNKRISTIFVNIILT